MILLTASDLSISFGTDVVLEKVSFSVAENDRLGVIGVNGCGKSTLLKLICGEMEPTSGSIHLSREKTVGILRQDDAFLAADLNLTLSDRMLAAFPDLLAAERRLAALEPLLSSGDDKIIREYTALHESFLSSGGLTFRSRADATLAKLGFDEETRKRTVGSLSGGQRTRLALAVQLVREPDLLLLDEPTNHLDVETMGWLENYLLSYPKCFIAVSHDRYFLDRVTTKTLHIEHHGAKLYAGGYTASMEQRRIDREIAERHWKNQQREIARQEAYIAQQRAWNRERNIIAAESRQKLLDKMERVERPKADAKGISMRFTSAGASGNDVLSVRGLTFGYGADPLFSDLTFTVKRSERIFVVGPNGCGKSTLVKLLLGKLPPRAGVIEPGYHVEVGYYDQENQNLTPENTVLDELWNAYPTRTETEIRSTLGLFRFTGDAVFRTVSVLSGGERARLTLAKLMLSRKNFLLLDEPTNHLDIDSREALGEALSAFDGTIFVVSHDRYLIEQLATRVLLLKPPFSGFGDLFSFPAPHPGKAFTDLSAEIAARQNGTIAALSEKEAPVIRNDTAPTLADVPAPPSQKERYLQAKQSASDARKRKTMLDRLHAEAQRLETELAAVEEELYGSAASDYTRAAELDSTRTSLEAQLMEVYEELEEWE